MKILVIGDFQGKLPDKLRKSILKKDFDLVVGVGDYAGISEWRSYFLDYFKRAVSGKERKTPEQYFGKKGYKKLLEKDSESFKKVFSFMNELNRRTVFVFGNGDDKWYDYPFENEKEKVTKDKIKFLRGMRAMEDITYGKTKIFGVNFVGFGGYMDVEANWNGKKDESYKRRMKRINNSQKRLNFLMKSKPEVLVLHYPPRGVFDIIRDKNNSYNGKSAGIEMFRKAILKYKPKLVLCGHMHEYQGVKRLGKSLVVNPGDAEKGKYAIIDYSENGKTKVRFES